jgi:hypothetical protein
LLYDIVPSLHFAVGVPDFAAVDVAGFVALLPSAVELAGALAGGAAAAGAAFVAGAGVALLAAAPPVPLALAAAPLLTPPWWLHAP